MSVVPAIRANGGRPSGEPPDRKLPIPKKRRRDPRTAPHAASRTDRRRPQRQRWRAPGRRLGHISRGPAARGGPARAALDRSAWSARWPASRRGRASARYFPAEHHADYQGGAFACDREFCRRTTRDCRSSCADHRATAASRAGAGRAGTRARTSARASGWPDACRGQARPPSQPRAATWRESGGPPVRRHTRPSHRYSGPTVRRTVSFSSRACKAEQVSRPAGVRYAVTDPDCDAIAIAIRSRYMPGHTGRLGLPVVANWSDVMLGAWQAPHCRPHPDASS